MSDKNKKSSQLDLSKKVTEEELMQRRKAAFAPVKSLTPDTSYSMCRNSVLVRREKVYLNVYNLVPCNTCLGCCGIPIHHSSIELYGIEIAFGGHPGDHSGVFETRPFHELADLGLLPPNVSLKKHALVGFTPLTYKQVEVLVDDIASDWPGNGYDLLRRNCNHFAKELGDALIHGFVMPNHVNRIARIGSSISCLLPSVLANTVWFPQYDLWGKNGRRLGHLGDKRKSNIVSASEAGKHATANSPENDGGGKGKGEGRGRESRQTSQESLEAKSCSSEGAREEESGRDFRVRVFAGVAAIMRLERGKTVNGAQRHDGRYAPPLQLHMDAGSNQPGAAASRKPPGLSTTGSSRLEEAGPPTPMKGRNSKGRNSKGRNSNSEVDAGEGGDDVTGPEAVQISVYPSAGAASEKSGMGVLDEEFGRVGSMGAGVEGMLDDLSAHGADDEDGSINSPSPDKSRGGGAGIKTSALD